LTLALGRRAAVPCRDRRGECRSAGQVYASDVEAYRVVVHGTAQRSVAPDVAMLGLRILEVDEDQRTAFDRCRSRVGTIVPQLQALLDGDDRVTTGNLSVKRHYDEFAERGQRERRYAASCPIVVECRPDVAAQAISEAIAAGVDRLSGPRFSVRDRLPVIEELLGEAIGAARRKAERVADAASRSLGGVVAVEEAPDERWEDSGSFEEEKAVELMSASAAPFDLHPAQVTLSASVRVTFSLAGNS
jgi:uncharacterized protein YggE